MSVKLASLPLNGMAPDNETVAKHLEEVAGWVREGRYGQLRSIINLFECEDGELQRGVCGKPMDYARTTGLLLLHAMRHDR